MTTTVTVKVPQDVSYVAQVVVFDAIPGGERRSFAVNVEPGKEQTFYAHSSRTIEVSEKPIDATQVGGPAEPATHTGLPVAGYRPQREETVALVNQNKAIEERVLRLMDALAETPAGTLDRRWYAIARTQIEQGFMALNRALFQPERASLPEDAQTAA